MQNSNKIIVIGGNAAGPAAAAKAKRINPDSDITLIESSEYISTGTCELPYLLSGEISDYMNIVFYTPEKFNKDKGVKVLINHTVKSIDPKLKEIRVINKIDNHSFELEYDRLILATGSNANEIHELPTSLDNVFSYKSVGDYLKISDYLDNNSVKKILIVGSGYIGLELSDALSQSGYEITILEKEKLPMPNSDTEIQHLIKELLDSLRLKFFSSAPDTEFITRNNKLINLVQDGRYLEYDMAIVAAGVSPNVFLAEDAGLKLGRNNGLIVDSRLRTSDPNIYAAGDNIETKNRITNDYNYFPLATHAHHHGHIAGENAAGGNRYAEPVVLNSAFKFGGKYISRVGLSLIEAEEFSVNAKYVTAVAYNKVKVMPGSAKVFGKIIYDKRSKMILGASFIGNEEISGYSDIISTFIYNKIEADKLSKIDFNYTPPLSPFINLLSILGRKITENI